jgi:glycosyltransferase involved in cell wall biosynthesis
VLLPTFDRASFLPQAIGSLVASTLGTWELVVVDDGSTDGTAAVLEPWRSDPRVRVERLERRQGLGAALNHGLAVATAPYVAYLPSDDAYLPDHLEVLVGLLERSPGAAGAVGALLDARAARTPELVQVVHRRVQERWVTDEELVTDDLERLFWARLRSHGPLLDCTTPTCIRTDHPDRRSRHIRESTGGGLNPFRARYGPAHPLRFQSSEGELVDEVARYERFRPGLREVSDDGLRILLVGELAYNPERVLAFEERGHRLFGLWMPDPWLYSTVGPLPFGSCRDLPRRGWREAVRDLRPDVIYALLNWQAIPFAHEVLTAGLGVPFVWHFKEGPWFSMEAGTWPQLVDLCTGSDAVVFSSEEQQAWFELVLPRRLDPGRCLVVDGDLPKRDWLDGVASPRLSEADGEPHTAVFGRPQGIDPAFVGRLAELGIHTHFHGLVRTMLGTYTDDHHLPDHEPMAVQWEPWIEEARRLAPRHFHLEPAVTPDRWVEVLSRYDAGWLHVFESRNGGDLRRATWDDLNVPARLGMMGVGGLPPIQRSNEGSAVATRSLTRRLGVGFAYEELDRLRGDLEQEVRTGDRRAAMWRVREQLTFDAHVDRLIQVFESLAGRRRDPTRGRAHGTAISIDGLLAEDGGRRSRPPVVGGRRPGP